MRTTTPTENCFHFSEYNSTNATFVWAYTMIDLCSIQIRFAKKGISYRWIHTYYLVFTDLLEMYTVNIQILISRKLRALKNVSLLQKESWNCTLCTLGVNKSDYSLRNCIGTLIWDLYVLRKKRLNWVLLFYLLLFFTFSVSSRKLYGLKRNALDWVLGKRGRMLPLQVIQYLQSLKIYKNIPS